jgi:hypothetical protein
MYPDLVRDHFFGETLFFPTGVPDPLLLESLVDGGWLTQIVVLGELLAMEGRRAECGPHGYGREAEGFHLGQVNERVTTRGLLPLSAQDTQLVRANFMVVVNPPRLALLYQPILHYRSAGMGEE